MPSSAACRPPRASARTSWLTSAAASSVIRSRLGRADRAFVEPLEAVVQAAQEARAAVAVDADVGPLHVVQHGPDGRPVEGGVGQPVQVVRRSPARTGRCSPTACRRRRTPASAACPAGASANCRGSNVCSNHGHTRTPHPPVRPARRVAAGDHPPLRLGAAGGTRRRGEPAVRLHGRPVGGRARGARTVRHLAGHRGRVLNELGELVRAGRVLAAGETVALRTGGCTCCRSRTRRNGCSRPTSCTGSPDGPPVPALLVIPEDELVPEPGVDQPCGCCEP